MRFLLHIKVVTIQGEQSGRSLSASAQKFFMCVAIFVDHLDLVTVHGHLIGPQKSR